MHQDFLYGHVEPLTWRDIEALPYYIVGVLLALAAYHGLEGAGLALRGDTAKAMLTVGMLGVYRVWSDTISE